MSSSEDHNTYEAVGHLSSEAGSVEKKLREIFSEEFSLLDQVNRLGMTILNELAETETDLEQRHSFLAGVLLCIVLRRCQAGTIVAARGLAPEADILARSALEAAFILGAFVKDPDTTIKALELDDVTTTRKLANALIAARLSLDFLDEEIVAGLRQLLAELEGKEEAKLLYAAQAKAAGMEDLYTTLYRGMSTTAVHLTSRAMSEHISFGPNAQRVEFGPDDKDVGIKVSNVICILVNTLRIVIHRFGLDRHRNAIEEYGRAFVLLNPRRHEGTHPSTPGSRL